MALPYCAENVCVQVDSDGTKLYAVGSRSHVTFVDPRESSTRVAGTLKSLDRDCGVRSLAFNQQLLSVGTGAGHLYFYDLRTKDWLLDKPGLKPCVLTTSEGWLVSLHTSLPTYLPTYSITYPPIPTYVIIYLIPTHLHVSSLPTHSFTFTYLRTYLIPYLPPPTYMYLPFLSTHPPSFTYIPNPLLTPIHLHVPYLPTYPLSYMYLFFIPTHLISYLAPPTYISAPGIL